MPGQRITALSNGLLTAVELVSHARSFVLS